MLSVKWFSATRARGGMPASDPCRLVFTAKPKGIRVNATMTRQILEMGKSYLRIGIDADKKLFMIQPVDAAQDSFKFITNKNSGQICSAMIWEWASENNMPAARLVGKWDEEAKCFVFDLNQK